MALERQIVPFMQQMAVSSAQFIPKEIIIIEMVYLVFKGPSDHRARTPPENWTQSICEERRKEEEQDRSRIGQKQNGVEEGQKRSGIEQKQDRIEVRSRIEQKQNRIEVGQDRSRIGQKQDDYKIEKDEVGYEQLIVTLMLLFGTSLLGLNSSERLSE